MSLVPEASPSLIVRVWLSCFTMVTSLSGATIGMSKMTGRVASSALAAALLSTGCITSPSAIVLHEEPHVSVRVQFDPRAGLGHTHPAVVSPEQLAVVLKGLWVQGRDVFGGFGLLGGREEAPAFAPQDIVSLSAHLSRALAKASPHDLVTFYLVSRQPGLGNVVTSGGLFIHGEHLYVILANAYTPPSSVQYENTYEIDTRDQPLLPIARYKFSVGFTPSTARISTAEARGKDRIQPYFDESKLVILDLQKLFPAASQPTS